MTTSTKTTSLLFIAATVLATTALQGCSSNYSRSAAMNNGNTAGNTATRTAKPAVPARPVNTSKGHHQYNLDATMKAHLGSHTHKGMGRCHSHAQVMNRRMYHCHYHTQDH